jgi:hypothetical protein
MWKTVHKERVFFSELLSFWTLSIVRYSKNQRMQRFENWICFRPQMRGETPTLFGPLERVNLNHRTTHVSITTAI